MASLAFRLVKVMDMGYMTVIYFILSVISLYLIYLIFGKYNPKADEKKSSLQLSAETVGLIWSTSIIFYIIRNLIGDNLPSPFHKLAGYDHFKLKEATSGAVFVYIFMQFFAPLKEKMKILYDRNF